MILRLGRRGPGFEPRNSPVFEVMRHDFSWVIPENNQRGCPISSEVRASVLCAESHGFEPRMGQFFFNQVFRTGSARVCGIQWITCRAHGVVVSRLLRMQKALGSNPSGSTFLLLRHNEHFLKLQSSTQQGGIFCLFYTAGLVV